MRSPSRPKSPKSVREFINERIGVQARDDTHQNEILNLKEEQQKSQHAALAEAIVLIPYWSELIVEQGE